MNDSTNDNSITMECPYCHKEITKVSEEFDCPYCHQHISMEYDTSNQMKQADNSSLAKLKSIFNLKNTNFVRYLTAILSILTVTFIILFGFTTIRSSQRINSLKYDNVQLSKDLNNANDKISSLDKSVEKYQRIANLNQDKVTELTKELENYKDQQATIDDLNAKLTELQSKYDALEADRNSILEQLDAKKAEAERVAQEQEAARQAQEAANASAGTVYWVSGGEVYHSTPNCVTLKRSSNIQSGTISQSGKSRACKVCH